MTNVLYPTAVNRCTMNDTVAFLGNLAEWVERLFRCYRRAVHAQCPSREEPELCDHDDCPFIDWPWVKRTSQMGPTNVVEIRPKDTARKEG